MNIISILNVAQLIITVLLIGSILLQQRGSGLSSTFGGAGSITAGRRGAEKKIFITSIVLSVLFLAVSIARFFVS